jgi:hypothetical protein
LVVIVVLLAVWGGMGAWWFLSRPEGRSTDSIGSFRHQLRVLERTAPTTVTPAYRMQPPQEIGVYGASLTMPSKAPSVMAARRRRVQKRRRDVFYGLVASIGGAAFLGFLPGLAVMWWLAALLTVALAVYVIILMQLRAAAAERTQKVRYLSSVGGTEGHATWAYSEPEPAYLLRRSAN